MKYDIIIDGAGTPNCFDAARCKRCGSVDHGIDVRDAYRAGIMHQRVHHGEGTRALTMGERRLFAMGAPMPVHVMLTNFGYRVVV